jgi:hypothetical protein
VGEADIGGVLSGRPSRRREARGHAGGVALPLGWGTGSTMRRRLTGGALVLGAVVGVSTSRGGAEVGCE